MSDLIKRQDVYDALEQYDREHVTPMGYDDYYNGFLHMIDSIPSADETAEWVDEEQPWGMPRKKCSRCGTPVDYNAMKFCSKCGAKVEKVR